MMKANSMLREVKVEEAVGMILSHDLTQIIPGQFKGRLFAKGHVIREEDIPSLLSIGKEHIYVMDLQSGYIHEDEAALRMAQAIAGDRIKLTQPHEGKVMLKSTMHGLAKVNKRFIDEANQLDQVVISTIKTNTVVKPEQSLVGTRVIPLIIEEAQVASVEQIARRYADLGETLVSVKPFLKLRVGLITTGSEVYKGRIKDKFGPAVKAKVNELGSEVIDQLYTTDDCDQIIEAIRHFERLEVDLILLTGGMSVDPDDRTPGAIRASGARVVSYGTPMLPGSMLMIAYLGSIPVMGLPGCVMHDQYTSFDVFLPRICAGETISREEVTVLGYGGLM